MARNREGKKKRHLFLKFIFVVLVLGAVATVVNKTGIMEKSDPWPTSELAERIPKAEKGKFSVYQIGDSLHITVKQIDEAYYNTYKKACKEAGFTVEANSATTDYEAFDGDGYKLELNYYQYNKELYIRLEEPVKMKALTWPDAALAHLVPVPESSKGNISTNNSERLIVYVGDMSPSQFEQYIQACKEYGFTQDHNQGDDYYRASNEDGVKLSLDYEGFNVVRIDLEKKKATSSNTSKGDASKEDTSKENISLEESRDQTSKEPEKEQSSEAPVSSTSDQNGIRKEVKEFVDKYEAFMDEYCEFLEAYDKSDLAAGLKYATLFGKYVDFASKADAMDKTDFNEAEDAYFSQAMLRIEAKLVKVAYKME